MIKTPDRNYDDESYDQVEELFGDRDLYEENKPYFSLDELKPPHY